MGLGDCTTARLVQLRGAQVNRNIDHTKLPAALNQWPAKQSHLISLSLARSSFVVVVVVAAEALLT